MNVVFRDGSREVPDHIGTWMTGIDTARLTFEEALVEMNKKQERDFINRAATKTINTHFQRLRRE